MQRNNALLHVRARAHLGARADQHADLAGIDQVEQLALLVGGVRVVNEGDLAFGNAGLDQLGLERVIDRESRVGDLEGGEFVIADFVQEVLDALAARVDQRAGLQHEISAGLKESPFVGVALLFDGCSDGAVAIEAKHLERVLDECGRILGGVLRRRREIAENKLCAALSIPLVVDRPDVLGCAIDLVARIVRQRRVDDPHIQAHLARVVHQPQRVVGLGVLLALLAFELIEDVRPGDQVVHELDLLVGRSADVQAATAAGHLRHREFLGPGLARRRALVRLADLFGVDALQVGHGHRIGDLLVHLQQLGQVVERGQHGALLDLAGGGVFVARLDRGECLHPGIELLHAARGQRVRVQVAQQRIHLDHRVRDRRARRAGDPAARSLQQAHLHEEVKRLLGALRRAHAGHVGERGRILEVLELVQLIDRQVVNPHVLEGDDVVARLVLQVADLLHALCDAVLDAAHAPTVALTLLAALGRLCLRQRSLEVLDLAADELELGFARDRNEAKGRMPHDDRIELAGRNPCEQAAAVGLLEVFFGGREDVRARVELDPVSRPLADQVVRHHNDWLLREAQPAALHDAGDQRHCLSGSDHVVEQRDRRLDHPPGGDLLRVAQIDGRVGAHGAKVRHTVVLALDGRVHQRVVLALDQRTALGVRLDPVAPDRDHLVADAPQVLGALLVHPPIVAATIVGDKLPAACDRREDFGDGVVFVLDVGAEVRRAQVTDTRHIDHTALG